LTLIVKGSVKEGQLLKPEDGVVKKVTVESWKS
jgi:hypothetical protein